MRSSCPLTIQLIFLVTCLAVASNASADFNNDGFADLAIGAPGENDEGMTTQIDAGAFSVIYGRSGGLDSENNQYLTEDWLLGEGAENNDILGTSFAIGDFNGDGVADLAIGSPGESVGSVAQAGAVHVLLGSDVFGVLNFLENTYWTQDEPGVEGTAEPNDRFGFALAAGDFNGDGFDDLAVGAPFEDDNASVTTESSGLVHILMGSAGGLQTSDDRQWTQDHTGNGVGEEHWFGWALASGDFDQDGYDDLAIGVPGDDLVTLERAGVVETLYGGVSGLHTRLANDLWHQDRSGITESAENHDSFGSELAVGDMNRDGYDDLIVGVPSEDFGSPAIINAGCLHVLFGSDGGITATGSQVFNQDSTDIGSLAEEGDRFGDVLAVGDFDGDGFNDLAVGVPHETWTHTDSGIVQVLWGSISGVAGPDQLVRQDHLYVFGADEVGDLFGYALAAGDFDRDGIDDLAIGSPGEDFGSPIVSNAGAVFELPGTPTGLSLDNQYWHQGKMAIGGTFEQDDRFGSALAAIPRTSLVFSDGFESGNWGAWTEVVQ